MSKFLIDENLSPTLARYLRLLGYNAISVEVAHLSGKTDEEIIVWSKINDRVIVTQDLGFGLVFTQTQSSPSVILLRSKKGTTEIFQRILRTIHRAGLLKEETSVPRLVVATEKKIRLFPRSQPPQKEDN